MTIRKAAMGIAIILAAGTAIILGMLTDVSASIRQRYPSADVALHEGHSPGAHPFLSMIRLFRGRHFLPRTQWITVQLTDEAQPVDLAVLLQFHVVTIRLIRCKVTNLGPLGSQTYPIYAELLNCDLSALPAEQKAVLRTSTENPQRLTYGAP